MGHSKRSGFGLLSAASAAVLSALLGLLFLLPAPAGAAAPCPNEAFRTGPSANLPDCRAYEMVSPPDLNGRLIEAISGFGFEPAHDLFPTELVSPSEDSIVYLTYNGPLSSPGDPSGIFDIYESERSSTGWQATRLISPSGEQATLDTPGGVSSDHRYAFTHASIVLGGTHPGGSLAGEAGVGYLANPDGSYEPVGLGSKGEEPLAQGRYISPGGAHVIFSTGNLGTQSLWCFQAEVGGKDCKELQLEPDAPPSGTGAVYDRAADGPTKVVSLLPGDLTPAAGQEAFYQGASKDGTAVAFKIGGTLYVRFSDSEDGETLKAAEGDPTYAGLSAEGRYLFYVVGGDSGDIHRLDTADGSDDQVNSTGDGEVVNVSADGSHVYFISESQIGGEGAVDEPNLYVWSEGTTEFVATVAPSDLVRTSGTREGLPALTNWTDWAVAPISSIELGPGAESSRTTPNGEVLVFESKAKLTDYENSGHTEVYRFDDEGNSIDCVSCPEDPLAEPPTKDARLQELELARVAMVIHNLSDDGSRVFFETPEALVGRDTDGVNDIYEWQEEGVGSRVDLISSGQSPEYPLLKPSAENLPKPNILFGVTPDGSDVVFLSQEPLLPGAGEGGTANLYDARVGGGFPEAAPPQICSEEACRGNAGGPAPAFSAPQSEKAGGKSNVKPRKQRCHRHRAAKGSKSRKGRRCSRKHSKRAGASSSASALAGAASEGQASRPPATTDSADSPSALAAAGSTDAAAVTAAASGEFELDLESAAAELSTTAAGSHPDFTTSFGLTHYFSGGQPRADAKARSVTVALPPGLLGNPNAVPRCTMGEFLAYANCSDDSQVGVADLLIIEQGRAFEPIYNLEPPHPDKEVARFGFFAAAFPVYIDVNVRTASDYGVTATVRNSPGLRALLEAKTILWGNPADSSHDEQRLTAVEAENCSKPGYNGEPCEAPGGKRPSTIAPDQRKAFMTNPSACQAGEVGFQVTSYQLPGQVFAKSAPLAPITDCQGLPFAPTFEAEPTNHAAGVATGLRTHLEIPQHLAPGERATATMREARVTLPEGMQIAAGAANWIEACSAAQVGFHEEVDAACPDGSKLGTATIASPALPEPIEGALYQREPRPGHPFGLWLAADALGLHIKLPAELEPDKRTGRLTALFADLPQVPVSAIDLEVWGGSRAPLRNPTSCGTYATEFSFAPHSQDPAVSGSSQMRIDEGCERPFDPKLSAGTTDPVAGKYSPLIVDLRRPDADQALRGFTLTLPDGLLAKIKGVGRCTEAQATAAACPPDSRIGSLTAAVGPGPDPLWVPQPGRPEPAVYLGGPYEGSPLSVVTLAPAQAGPFDLGTVVVRSGLGLDPDTNRAVVKADPLPQFFEGVGLDYRALHIAIDRPGFALNPTDCREMAFDSTMASAQGAVAHPSARFQVGGCKALGFKPRLSLALQGATERGGYPALTATLKARGGDANIARAQVSLPHSEFLEQGHIGTICTRVQFAADKCPKRSVYGTAKAWTPLLAKPLSGPVYLRSSKNPLPDLVAALGGELEVNLSARIDSHKGGIRTTFAAVPDAPVTKFVLRMKGGKKGLLVNSTDVCRRAHRAEANFAAQSGRAARLAPRLEFKGCGGETGTGR